MIYEYRFHKNAIQKWKKKNRMLLSSTIVNVIADLVFLFCFVSLLLFFKYCIYDDQYICSSQNTPVQYFWHMPCVWKLCYSTMSNWKNGAVWLKNAMQQHNTQKELISPIDTFEKAMNDYSRKDQKITLNFDYRLTVLKEREKFKGNSIFFSTFCLNVQNDEHAHSTKMHSIEWLELEFSSLIF